MILETEENLAAGGDAIARAPDGRVVFVEGAAPEEAVEVEITRDNPLFLRARVTRVVRPSPHRVTPRCRHFGECGGCVLQHVDHASQVASKQASLLETLRRIGRVDPATIRVDPPWMGEPYRYRTRVRFFVQPGKAGYKRARTNDVFDAKECPILIEPLEKLLVEHDRKSTCEVSAPSSLFAQANDSGNAAMIEHLASLLDPELQSALELYGGSGNFTRTLAERIPRVTMVESNREAVAIARAELPRVQMVEAPAEDAPEDPVDLVLVDPPRSGMSERALERAARAAARLLVYVSCDPATFARDAQRLALRGLALETIRLFDLYPQTAHAEVIGRFRRTNA